MKKIKERIYIKDNYDGQEYCISGKKHFYLIDVTDTYNIQSKGGKARAQKLTAEQRKAISLKGVQAKRDKKKTVDNLACK